MMRQLPIDVLPLAISNRFLEYDTHKKLMNYDFYNPSDSQESAAVSAHTINHGKYILISCIIIYLRI